MAPKRKTHVSQTASPAPASAPTPSRSNQTVAIEIEQRRRPKPTDETPHPKAQQEAEPDEVEEEEYDEEAANAALVADPWTDDEEIGLFKGLIRWKPTGMHKHFHLLSLHQHLLSNGYIQPKAPHTRIPGIWTKLHDLYDLEALDEREDANAAPWSTSEDEDEEEDEKDELGDDDEEPEHQHDTEFELPSDEFGGLVWRARFPDTEDEEEKQSSPPLDEDLVARPDSPPVRFTPSFEIAMEEEAQQTPSTRASKSKSAASAKAKGNKTSLNPRRSSRVADSVDPDDDGDEDEEEGSEDDEQSEQESLASGTPAPSKASKAKGKRKAPAAKPRASKRKR